MWRMNSANKIAIGAFFLRASRKRNRFETGKKGCTHTQNVCNPLHFNVRVQKEIVYILLFKNGAGKHYMVLERNE